MALLQGRIYSLPIDIFIYSYHSFICAPLIKRRHTPNRPITDQWSASYGGRLKITNSMNSWLTLSPTHSFTRISLLSYSRYYNSLFKINCRMVSSHENIVIKGNYYPPFDTKFSLFLLCWWLMIIMCLTEH